MSELALELIAKEKKERTGKLDLGKCGLTQIPNEIVSLTWLEELSFCNEKWDQFTQSWIASSNVGAYNNFASPELPEFITQLKNLKRFYFGGDYSMHNRWGLNNIDILSELIQLEILNLSTNQIKDISGLKKLKRISNLNLTFNGIDHCNDLENMSNMLHLDVSDNYLTDLIFVQNMEKLKSLDARSNRIQDLNPLSRLTNLESLYLSSNKISNITAIETCLNIQRLGMHSNLLKDISPLEKIPKLVYLNLSHNKITNIQSLKKNTNLQELLLRNNQIDDLSPVYHIFKKSQLTKDEFEDIIDVDNNPLTNPPMSVVKKGRDAILDWFDQIDGQRGVEYLYEARIIIAGESGAGKTTLYRKLSDDTIPVPDKKQESTHGINISFNREFKHHVKNAIIRANIWDFGGQDIQSLLHQYFFSSNNLFILVCDNRDENTRFDYWFEIITRLGTNSSVLVVRNKKGRESATQEFKKGEYQERFKGLEVECIDVDFKVNDKRWELLIQYIEERLSKLNKVNAPVPRLWKPIREDIQDRKTAGDKFISITDYQAICQKHGLTKEKYQDQCLSYLHWLGHALHYNGSGDTGLSNTVFIDPQWITTGLYEIMKEDHYAKAKKGRFTQKDIIRIWQEQDYRTEERNLLLNLLLKDQFDLCYRVSETNNYLVPVLISNVKNAPKIEEEAPYTLRYKFPFMPFGFFSRLIVRLYRNIWDDYVWLTGVWLKDDAGCYAQLEHYRDPDSGDTIIEISIYGDVRKRKDLLSKIRHELTYIKNDIFKNLTVIEQIPCPCEKCQSLQIPYFHNRNELENMIENHVFDSQCKNSGMVVRIGDLLHAVINQMEIEKQIINKYKGMTKERISIHLENIGNPTVNQDQMVSQTQKTTVSIDIQVITEIKDEFEMLKEDIEDERKLLEKQVGKDEIDVTVRDIEKVEKAIQELETAQNESKEPATKSKNRLKRFMDDLKDEESGLFKTLKALRKGRDYGVSLAEGYNKIAENIGMPSVPPIALELIKKL